MPRTTSRRKSLPLPRRTQQTFRPRKRHRVHPTANTHQEHDQGRSTQAAGSGAQCDGRRVRNAKRRGANAQ